MSRFDWDDYPDEARDYDPTTPRTHSQAHDDIYGEDDDQTGPPTCHTPTAHPPHPWKST